MSRPLKWIGGISVYLTATYASYHIAKIMYLPDAPTDASVQENSSTVSKPYKTLAADYDAMIGWDEYFMGMNSKRRHLIEKCTGNVLETSAGTGRNLEFYPKNLESLLITDQIPEMLEIAYRKPASFKETKFALMDAHSLNMPDASVDTVVDTFGLCSFYDPIKALKEMKRIIKPEGRVLLLQHGRSHYDWLNTALDRTAAAHALKWGCWWNRDILNLVQKAGFRIVDERRYHFGTTYMLVLAPN